MTFDIEDWFHLCGTAILDQQDRWASLESVVEQYTRWIVKTLDEYEVKATFFVLGWIAERYPQLVRLIAEHGHEIGSHSYWHQPVYAMSPEDFRDDLQRSINAIKEAADCEVRGFRAPAFSIRPSCAWAFDAILDCGLSYDASLSPVRRAHGGYACPKEAHTLTTPCGASLPELPISSMRLLGRSFAFSGGGYLRVLPWNVIKRGMAQHEAAGGPAVVYLHPWDFAVDCPVPAMSRWHRFKCYHGRAGTASKLHRLLEGYRWGTCAQVLANTLGVKG